LLFVLFLLRNWLQLHCHARSSRSGAAQWLQLLLLLLLLLLLALLLSLPTAAWVRCHDSHCSSLLLRWQVLFEP
jgi:cytochrome b561